MPTIQRRAFFGALALPAIAVAAGPIEALAAKPSRFAEWERLKESFREPLPDEASDEDADARSDQFFHYDYLIRTTPCTTREEAAAKVRALLDPEIGMPEGSCDMDVPTLQQVLIFLAGH
jgi:hypothetical protein